MTDGTAAPPAGRRVTHTFHGHDQPDILVTVDEVDYRGELQAWSVDADGGWWAHVAWRKKPGSTFLSIFPASQVKPAGAWGATRSRPDLRRRPSSGWAVGTVPDVSEWISWAEASALTGIPTPTIEHAVRVDRINHRPRNGSHPTLQRDSVIAWAAWYREQQQMRATRARRPMADRPVVRVGEPPTVPGKWISVQDAARELGVSESTVRRHARLGLVKSHRSGQQTWVDADSVAAYKDEEARWCTLNAAAALIGCSRHDVERLCAQGVITQRHVARARPSVLKTEANAFVPVWKERLLERDRRRVQDDRRRPASSPDDEHVWISTAVTARLLDLSATRVRQRAQDGTIPHVRTSGRLWFRRDHVEVLAARKAFEERAERAVSLGR